MTSQSTNPGVAVAVEEFRVAEASRSDLRACYDITESVYNADRPDEPIPPFDAVVKLWSQPTWFPLGRRRFWVARTGDGQIAGFAPAYFPEAENGNVAVLDLRVDPDLRRRGIGTAMLRSILPELAREERDLIAGWGLVGDGDGDQWTRSLGFARVQAALHQRLEIAEADPLRWQVPAPSGYRTERWIGAAPDELVGSFARARSAIVDAPHGDSSFDDPVWTVERVRENEADSARRGAELRTVVAVSEQDESVAALTELEFRPDTPDCGYQYDTAVLAGHRGHGLGRFIKAEMLRWVLPDHPAITRVTTSTAADNVFMQRVNEQIGFTTVRTVISVEASLSKVQARLSES